MARLLIVVCFAWMAMGAPQADIGQLTGVEPVASEGRSSDLPMEHRVDQDVHPVEIIVDRVLSSETASALDSAAARVASVFGDIVDDLGDFVVSTVEDLPETIDLVSQRVGDAVSQSGEKVVIIVKGVRNNVKNAKNETVEVVQNTVNKVGNAIERSEVLPSILTLGERLGSTIGRIADSIISNFGNIDKAVAGGIRRVSSTPSVNNSITDEQESAGQLDFQPVEDQQTFLPDEKEPNISENELRSF